MKNLTFNFFLSVILILSSFVLEDNSNIAAEEVKVCCNFFTVDGVTQEDDGSGCCVYKIRVTNKSRCSIFLYDELGNEVADFPASSNQTSTQSFVVCGGSFTYTFGADDAKCNQTLDVSSNC